MKDIQTWLGHSNYNFTANTYVHSSKESHVQIAQSFSEKLPALIEPLIEVTGKNRFWILILRFKIPFVRKM